MFTKILVLLSLTLSILLPLPVGHLEAQTGIDESSSNAIPARNVASKPGNMAEELSSAITPPSGPPASIIGTAVAFNEVWVNVAVKPPAFVGGVTTCGSTLNWGGIFPAGATGFTTCTITLSSVPPGPCYINLAGDDVASIKVWVDSQVTVISSTTNSSWFTYGANVNPSTFFDTAVLTPELGWWSQTAGSSSSDIVIYASPYPTLQYAPNSLTIVYQ